MVHNVAPFIRGFQSGSFFDRYSSKDNLNCVASIVEDINQRGSHVMKNISICLFILANRS